MDDDRLHTSRKFADTTKFPPSNCEDVGNLKDSQHDTIPNHPGPQDYTYSAKDSVPRSLALNDYLRSIERTERISSSFTNQNHTYSSKNYVLGSGPSTCDPASISSRLEALLLDNNETEMTLLAFNGSQRKDVGVADIDPNTNVLSVKEEHSANANMPSSFSPVSLDAGGREDHDHLSFREDKVRHEICQNAKFMPNQSVLHQPKQTVSACAESLESAELGDDFIDTKAEAFPQEHEDGFTASRVLLDDIGGRSLLLEIGSWILIGRPTGSEHWLSNEAAPILSLSDIGGYPNHLTDKNLGITQCAGYRAGQSNASGSNQPTKQSSKVVHNPSFINSVDKGKRRLSSNEEEENDEEEGEDEPGSAKKKRSDYHGFVCPFYTRLSHKVMPQANGQGRNKYRVCATTKFPDIPRLKEDIKRVHKVPIRCPRCQETFKSQGLVDSHLARDVVCDKKVSDSQSVMFMTSAEEEQLKKKWQTLGPEEKWKEIYLIFFPGESVPSPFEHDPSPQLSPFAPQDAGFTAFLHSKFPEALEPELELTLDNLGLDTHKRAKLISEIVSKASSCYIGLWKSFHAQQLTCFQQHSEVTGSVQQELDANDIFDTEFSATFLDLPMGYDGQQANTSDDPIVHTAYDNCTTRTPSIQRTLPLTPPYSTGKTNVSPAGRDRPPHCRLLSFNSDSPIGLTSYENSFCTCDACFGDLMKSPELPPACLSRQNEFQAFAQSNTGGEPSLWRLRDFDHYLSTETQAQAAANFAYRDFQHDHSDLGD